MRSEAATHLQSGIIRKLVTCSLAFVLALAVVGSLSRPREVYELSLSNVLGEESIRQREEALAKKLYDAETQEVKSGFVSGNLEDRVQSLEHEATELAHQLSSTRDESSLFGDPLPPSGRKQQLAEVSQDEDSGLLKRNGLHMKLDGDAGNIISALSAISSSSAKQPIINIYVGQRPVDTASESANEESNNLQLPVEHRNEESLVGNLEAKLREQDKEIERLLKARRVPVSLRNTGQSKGGARMQSLSQLSNSNDDLQIGNIEAQIDRTLADLSQSDHHIKHPRSLSGHGVKISMLAKALNAATASGSQFELSGQDQSQQSADLAKFMSPSAARALAIAQSKIADSSSNGDNSGSESTSSLNAPFSGSDDSSQAPFNPSSPATLTGSDNEDVPPLPVERSRPVLHGTRVQEDLQAPATEETNPFGSEDVASNEDTAAPAVSSDSLRREASDRMRALEEAAGAAPRQAVTGSIGDFLPTALKGALHRHDLIRRMERQAKREQRGGEHAREAEEEARLRAYRHVDSRNIFDDNQRAVQAAAAAAAAVPPEESAYKVEQARLIRGLEAAAASFGGKPAQLDQMKDGKKGVIFL